MYRSWHRVEWEGLEKIPTDGGALLVSNHAGAIPADAPAIMHGIEEELGRPVYGLADEIFKTLPGGRHAVVPRRRRARPPRQRLPAPARAEAARPRVPRGHQGHRQDLRRALPAPPLRPRRLRADRDAGRRAGRADRGGRRRGGHADRSSRSTRSPRLLGVPYVPITANMLAFGPLGGLVPLPGQDQDPRARPGALRRGARPAPLLAEPDHGRVRAHPAADPGGAATTCSASASRSGSGERPMGKRVLITGLGTFWGSRVAQALEADPTVDVIVGLDRNEPTVPLERTEYVRSDESYSILARIVKAAKIDTIVHTFLVVDSTQMKSRTIHEINVIGTMNLFAAASAPGSTVRNVVVKSSTLVYGAHPKDPVWFSEETRRAQPPEGDGRAQPPRGGGLRARLRGRQPARERGHAAVLQRARPRHHHAAGQGARAAGGAVGVRLRPALPVRARDRRGAGDPVRARGRACRASTTWPATGCSRGARWPRSAASAPSRSRRSASGLLSAPLTRLGLDLPPELLDLLRHGRGVDNRRLKRVGLRLPLHVSRHRRRLRGGAPHPARWSAAARPPTSTSATSSSSSATPPPWSARDEALSSPSERRAQFAVRGPVPGLGGRL